MKKQLSIFLPALSSVILFGITVFWFILPQINQIIFNEKLEQIRELTYTAWSVLDSYHEQVVAGVLEPVEAQARAISRLRMLRYGLEGKDYFWINDLHPRMIMHPYQVELVGQDLSTFSDRNGVRVFVQAVALVQKEGEGYIEYLWQWKDDPNRIEKKLSYVKIFKPWGWVVGTGIYVGDVQEEVAALRGDLILVGSAVFALVVLMAAIVTHRALAQERERLRLEHKLRVMATVDPLTGAFNRRYFWQRAKVEVQRHQRYDHPLAVLMLDLDHFKRINDTFGHLSGDVVLKAVVECCLNGLRKSDIFGRIGGEEFAALLVETQLGEALEVAERLRAAMANMDIKLDEQTVRVTVSLGVTQVHQDDCTWEEVMDRVDQALYRAKDQGRNRVEYILRNNIDDGAEG